MLFHSSIRRELAHSFGATLVVLFTIVLTILLIRTLGLASRGSVNPEEVMLVLGYTVLGRMPTILTLALFIAIVFALSRMYRDSEMIIWLASGRSLGGFVGPVLRFAWPVLLVITVMVLFVWPWANQQTEELRDRFARRGDLERVAPGQFQESSSGRRVFFIDKDTASGTEGRNIFISSTEPDGRETITSARSGRIEWVGEQQMLMLNNGQRLETDPDQGGMKVSEFELYAVQVGASTRISSGALGLKSRPSRQLIAEPTQAHLGELGWRIGMPLAAFNFVLIALAATTGNPRAGRGGNLFFTLFAFVFYFNLLNLGQNWVASNLVSLGAFMLLLHGSVFMLASLWLLKRHHNISLRGWLSARRAARSAALGAQPA
jgi:lipopolysaccharide export system permease protein